jgi:HNH/ENDO VII superfamily nuclease
MKVLFPFTETLDSVSVHRAEERFGLSTCRGGSGSAGARLRPVLGGWVLIVLILQAACATGVPHGGMWVDHGYSSSASRLHEVALGVDEAVDGPVYRSLPTEFGAIQVSTFELNQALASLVLSMPLRVASSASPLCLDRKMKDPVNTVALHGHRGPHPQEYHQTVYDHLTRATRNCPNQQECSVALRRALRELATEISDTSSRLYRLLTSKSSPP